MKNPKFKINKLTAALAFFGLWIADCGLSQTTVLFPLAQMTGTTNDTTVTVRPINNPVNFRSQIYWLPPAGIQLRTTNGSATTNLIPNDYAVTIAGVPGSWRISVNDTNVTLNAAEIGNLTTYTFTNLLPGVFQLIAGSNITLSPPIGKGVVTITASGGGGGGSATNAYQIKAGNNLIAIVTNQTDFIYTISGVSQTNGYPWGVLYDAAGAARSVTNGYPWGSSYDAAGTAHSATNGYPWSTLYDSAGSAVAVTNGYPWGVLYDTAGSATAATNGYPWGVLYDAGGTARSATNGYPWGSLYDAAGAAHSATNGYPWSTLYDSAGSAVAVTNGYPWSVLYDSTGSATAATNGFPWGVLYDAAGAAQAATNGISIASGLAAFRGTNTFAPTNVATVSKAGLVKPDGSTITVGSDGTISATTGGGGTVTSAGLSMPGEFSVANSPVTTIGTLTVTRTADANFLGLGATNLGFIKVTNAASIGGQAAISTLVLTNGFTNQSLTASTLVGTDANKKVTSIPNAIGAITNDGAGNFGYVPLVDASGLTANHHAATGASTNLISSEDATGYTNTVAWTHDGATTNLTVAFNGTLQSFTVTNGPNVFFGYSGANGSCSFRITTNVNLRFAYQPKWLVGSNSVITNGVLSLTSYGGTNATQIEAAIGENQ
ncbi:MAG TPA: hypothetical protein VH597_00285 [Verrucomicrobiae bacterium]|jgi:hypothetical protein|nr:hypothetical protein [Verrucomicrobiae bacterium]